jgi:hypothetical protein
MARPGEYTPEIGTEICRRIAEGQSVRSIVKDDDMPASSMVYKWLLEPEHKAFSEQCAAARAVQAEAMFEELLEIADDGSNDWMEKERQDGSSITVPDSEHKRASRVLVGGIREMSADARCSSAVGSFGGIAAMPFALRKFPVPAPKFPDLQKHFPVPLNREFASEALQQLHYFRSLARQK